MKLYFKMNLFTSLLYFQTQPKKIIYSHNLKCLASDKLKTTSFTNTERVNFKLCENI